MDPFPLTLRLARAGSLSGAVTGCAPGMRLGSRRGPPIRGAEPTRWWGAASSAAIAALALGGAWLALLCGVGRDTTRARMARARLARGSASRA